HASATWANSQPGGRIGEDFRSPRFLRSLLKKGSDPFRGKSVKLRRGSDPFFSRLQSVREDELPAWAARMTEPPDNPLTFEQALAELDQIVRDLEDGQLGLE